MSTKNISSEYFSEVTRRLMLALKIQKEYEIAALMGFKKDSFSARKKRGALPEDKIKLLCAKELINFDWVMTGEGDMRQSEAARTGHQIESQLSDRELHVLIYEAVEEVANELAQEEGLFSTKDKAFLASELFRIFSKKDNRQYVTREAMLDQAVVLWFLHGNRERINYLLKKLKLTHEDDAYAVVQDFIELRELVEQDGKKKATKSKK